MNCKVAILGLLLSLLSLKNATGYTNLTEIEFTGNLYTKDPSIEKEIKECSDPKSDICIKLQKDICDFILLKYFKGMIEGDINCTASITPKTNYVIGGITMKFYFADPQLQGMPINLECSVFPILLRTALSYLKYKNSTNLRDIKFIKPNLPRLVWSEKKVQFQVFAGLLFGNKTVYPHQLTPGFKELAESCLQFLIPEGHFANPLYPGFYIHIYNIDYILTEPVMINYTLEYPTSYLQGLGLDFTCMAFPEFLQWGLLNPQNKLPVNLGPTVEVTLISKLPETVTTTPVSNMSSTSTIETMTTTTPVSNTSSTSTIVTVSKETTSTKRTTVKGDGNRLAYFNHIIWTGFLMVNLLQSI